MILCSSTASGPMASSAASISLRRGASLGAPSFGECEQSVTPQPQRLELRRQRAERVAFAQRGTRLVRPVEGDQRQRPLQMPMACGGDVVGGRIDCVEQGQSLGRALLLQGFGDEIEPRAGVMRVARERLAQQFFGRRRNRR